MRAVWYDRPGPAADVLTVGDLLRLEPGPGEVVVRIHASGINPADIKRRSGWGSSTFGQSIRRVFPHTDGAGVVAALGPGVDESLAGRRVWIWNAGGGDFYRIPGAIERGTAAEYVALPVRYVQFAFLSPASGEARIKTYKICPAVSASDWIADIGELLRFVRDGPRAHIRFMTAWTS